MTKLVDVRDLKSLAFGRAGSIPAGRTSHIIPRNLSDNRHPRHAIAAKRRLDRGSRTPGARGHCLEKANAYGKKTHLFANFQACDFVKPVAIGARLVVCVAPATRSQAS